MDRCLVEELETAVKQKYGFEVKSHVLELFGLCSNCAAKN